MRRSRFEGRRTNRSVVSVPTLAQTRPNSCANAAREEVVRLRVEEFDTFCATANGTPLLAQRHR
jgi:hypothetical protein